MLQRWSARRVFLAAGLLVVTTLAVVVGGEAFFPAENIGAHPPDCGTGPSMILAAQAELIDAVVATANVGHLAQFVDARHWRDIPAPPHAG